MTTSAPRVPADPDEFPAEGPNALGSILHRALARLVDALLVAVPFIALAVPYLEIEGDQVSLDELPTWFLAAQLGVAVVYEVLLLGFWGGRTVGKRVMGLRVARYEDGGKPTFGQAGQRVLLPALPAAVPNPFVAALQYLVYGSSLFHPLRRGWHDRYAGTIVVRTR